MFFRIDPAAGVAIFDQVIRQVKFAVARGAVVAGKRVPSVRELAKELAINPNTVARAYQQLQSDGILTAVRGTGLEITPEAKRICRKETAAIVREMLRQAFVEAARGGFDAAELQAMWEKEFGVFEKERSEACPTP